MSENKGINFDAVKGIKLEAGMYTDAAKAGKSFDTYLEDVFVSEKIYESPSIYSGKTKYEVAKIQKELRAEGKPVPKTAFEMKLEAHGIDINHSKVGDFAISKSSDLAVLFPTYISNVVYAGQLDTSMIEMFTDNMVVIDKTRFARLYLEDSANDRSLAASGKAGDDIFPITHIKRSDSTDELTRYGRIVECDVEDMNDLPLAVYNLQLRRIGMQIGVDKTTKMFEILTSNLPAANIESAASSGEIKALDVIKLASSMSSPYEMQVAGAPIAMCRLYWETMSGMTNPRDQKNEIGIPLPAVKRWDNGGLTADYILGVDKRFAFAWVTNDNMVLQETEKVIRSQRLDTVISMRGVVSVLDSAAIGALDVTA